MTPSPPASLLRSLGSFAVLFLVIMIGGSFFYAANSSAVMKAAPPERLGIASGVLRTFAGLGMVFSFTVAILVAAHAMPRGTAFAVFVGTTSLHGADAQAFTSGLSTAFYTLTGIMVLAAALSAVRGRPGAVRRTTPSG
ncbi:hypothetical protein ACIGXI_17985 [Kitasatospora aureofaciens]|uniref:hypothetical protein n=1 Tax=Kitasatospora aureofaciens TaxID=1894 RepID=UPI0037C74652